MLSKRRNSAICISFQYISRFNKILYPAKISSTGYTHETYTHNIPTKNAN